MPPRRADGFADCGRINGGKLGQRSLARRAVSFYSAFGYKTYLKEGDVCSVPPTDSTGMTEVKNLTNFGIQTSSDTEDVKTYDDTAGGWTYNVVTGQSYSVDCTLNIDMLDDGYLLLKKASLGAATGVTVEWFRESPKTAGDCATGADITGAETHAGVSYVTDFSEEIEAGNVAKVSFTLTGLGAVVWQEATTT